MKKTITTLVVSLITLFAGADLHSKSPRSLHFEANYQLVMDFSYAQYSSGEMGTRKWDVVFMYPTAGIRYYPPALNGWGIGFLAGKGGEGPDASSGKSAEKAGLSASALNRGSAEENMFFEARLFYDLGRRMGKDDYKLQLQGGAGRISFKGTSIMRYEIRNFSNALLFSDSTPEKSYSGNAHYLQGGVSYTIKKLVMLTAGAWALIDKEIYSYDHPGPSANESYFDFVGDGRMRVEAAKSLYYVFSVGIFI